MKLVEATMVALLLGTTTATPLEGVSHREPRPFFSFITIATESCTTDDTTNPDGTCYSSSDCTNLSGTASGKCAKGLGVCCYFTKSCAETISTNSTSFVNPNYPGTDTVSNNCVATIDLIGSNICQLRLDFTKFELAQPNVNGVCDTDFFSITGTENDDLVPMLCGTNKDQHMYVDVSTTATPQIKVDMGTSTDAREWEVKVTQIECDSLYKAPEGCRRYYTGTSGTVTSYNHKTPTAAEIVSGDVNVHLADLNYRACIATQPDYCSITWSPYESTNLFAFLMSGSADTNVDFVGLEATFASAYDPICTDYIGIPGGSYTLGGIAAVADRFCTVFFPIVTSTSQPFYLHVVTDSDEIPDTSNTGFSLEYRMLPC